MVHVQKATLAASTLMVAVLMSSCSSGTRTPSAAAASSSAIVQFTCCKAADVSTIRHPGETFAVHWIRTIQPRPAGARSVPVELNASLSSEHHDVSLLKASEGQKPSKYVRAAKIHTTDAARTAPVSSITIPRTAAPGLYDLTTTVSSSDGTVTAGSIIRIQAR